MIRLPHLPLESPTLAEGSEVRCFSPESKAWGGCASSCPHASTIGAPLQHPSVRVQLHPQLSLEGEGAFTLLLAPVSDPSVILGGWHSRCPWHSGWSQSSNSVSRPE